MRRSSICWSIFSERQHSDLCVLDAEGQPTVQPTAADLGLPGRIDPSRSFVRTRRYTPWNAHRGGFEAERLVVQAGSVFWIDAPEGGIQRGQRSVGRFTEAGLGRVWIAPPLLDRSVPAFKEAVPAQPAAPAKAVPPTALLNWFLERGGQAHRAAALDARVADLEVRVSDLYDAVKHELGRSDDGDVPSGPSSSQWREVARRAENATHSEALLDVLFADKKGIACRQRPGWSDELWQSGGRMSFSAAFKALIASAALESAHLPATLALLARRMSKRGEVGVRNENRQSDHRNLQEARR